MLVIVLEGKEREKGVKKKKIFEIIEVGKFLSLVNYIDVRSLEILNRKNITNIKFIYVIGKLYKTKEGEKILKGIRYGVMLCVW